MQDINELNPVDYFNRNCIQEMYDLLLRLKNVKSTGIDSLTYLTNKEDSAKRMIVIENDCFVAKMKNGLNMEINLPYTPFMMLQKYIYKNSFSLALSHVIYDVMENENLYVRVGTKFYKKTEKTDRYGIVRTQLKAWDRLTIIDDHGKPYLETIPKFDDFTIEPDNVNYKRIIGNNYNVYSPFSHTPLKYEKESQLKWTFTFMRHIFGSQYEIGLKYMKVLYNYPKQALPILVLISKERSTGKSTFIDWVSMIFGANTVVINPENIKSQFNGSYADKNIILIEESYFEGRQATEKLKNLSTQKKILVNNKHTQEFSIPFYGKIIINSNDEDKFSKVDEPEIRYWVRKLPTIKGKANHKILEDLVSEIPYFLDYLNNLPEIDFTKSRMVFEAVELQTDALKKVKLESRSELHKEILIKLDDWCMQNTQLQFVYFNGLDVKDEFFKSNNRVSSAYIQKVIRNEIGLIPSNKTKRYKPFQNLDSLSNKSKVGKPFKYENPFYKIDIEEDVKTVSEDDDLPF